MEVEEPVVGICGDSGGFYYNRQAASADELEDDEEGDIRFTRSNSMGGTLGTLARTSWIARRRQWKKMRKKRRGSGGSEDSRRVSPTIAQYINNIKIYLKQFRSNRVCKMKGLFAHLFKKHQGGWLRNEILLFQLKEMYVLTSRKILFSRKICYFSH